MWWTEITNWISAFFDKPVVIAGASLGTIGGISLIILSKTSFGKRAVKNLKITMNDLSLNVQNLENSNVEFERKIEDTLTENNNAQKIEIEKTNSRVDTLEKLVIAMAQSSHNEKVKTSLKDFKEERYGKEKLGSEIKEKI